MFKIYMDWSSFNAKKKKVSINLRFHGWQRGYRIQLSKYIQIICLNQRKAFHIKCSMLIIKPHRFDATTLYSRDFAILLPLSWKCEALIPNKWLSLFTTACQIGLQGHSRSICQEVVGCVRCLVGRGIDSDDIVGFTFQTDVAC